LNVWLALLLAAVALSVERVCYVWIARAPESFLRWCARLPRAARCSPIAVVCVLFVVFKLVQGAVLLGWDLARGDGLPTVTASPAAVVGVALVLVGQTLSTLVFYRLGWIGIFFGDRLGYAVSWCRAFPFSVLAHPQYVGAVMTIWGLFLITRFPHEDWVLVPALETALYMVGAHLEGVGFRPVVVGV